MLEYSSDSQQTWHANPPLSPRSPHTAKEEKMKKLKQLQMAVANLIKFVVWPTLPGGGL